MRTTIDIYDPVMRALRKLQQRSGKSLGRLVSDLLAKTLGGRPPSPPDAPFAWASRPRGAVVDIADK